jgi:hypothetical protein
MMEQTNPNNQDINHVSIKQRFYAVLQVSILFAAVVMVFTWVVYWRSEDKLIGGFDLSDPIKAIKYDLANGITAFIFCAIASLVILMFVRIRKWHLTLKWVLIGSSVIIAFFVSGLYSDIFSTKTQTDMLMDPEMQAEYDWAKRIKKINDCREFESYALNTCIYASVKTRDDVNTCLAIIDEKIPVTNRGRTFDNIPCWLAYGMYANDPTACENIDDVMCYGLVARDLTPAAGITTCQGVTDRMPQITCFGEIINKHWTGKWTSTYQAICDGIPAQIRNDLSIKDDCRQARNWE